MLIYEKNNKLNINFDPSKSIEETPDIQIGENEIKLGDAEITSENVLPAPTNEDVGKIVSVGEDGSYELVPFQEPTGTIEITENGIVDVADYASADVQVPNPSSGSVSITQNGTYDVTEKASAVVNVSTPFDGKYVQIVNNYGEDITISYIGNGGAIKNAKLANEATLNVPISVTTYTDKSGDTHYYGFVTVFSDTLWNGADTLTVSNATVYTTQNRSFVVIECEPMIAWTTPVVTIPAR